MSCLSRRSQLTAHTEGLVCLLMASLAVIIKIHRSRDVATILTAARRKGQLQYEDQLLRIAPDISPTVRAARRAFNPICAELIKKGIRFQMNFPAVLVFKANGVQKTFKDPKDAKTYLDGNM